MHSDIDSYIYRRIVEQFADGIIFADHFGFIKVWNSGAEAIFGYSKEEALGQSLDLIIPEGLRGAHWAGFNQALSTGLSKYGRKALVTRSMHKDGRKLYVELSFTLIRNGRHHVIGSVAGIRDITSKYMARQSSS